MKEIQFIRHYSLKEPFNHWTNMALDQFVDLTTGKADPNIDPSIIEYLTETSNFSKKVDVLVASAKKRTIETAKTINHLNNHKVPILSESFFDEIPSVFIKIPTEKEFNLMQKQNRLVLEKRRILNKKGKIARLQQIDEYLRLLPFTNILVVSHSYLIGLLNYWFNEINRNPNKFDEDYADKFEIGAILEGFKTKI